MPFKSQAQARKFAVLAAQGKISRKTFNEWASETNFKKLPKKVAKKKK